MRRYKMVIISIIILLLINNIMHSKVSYALDIANSKIKYYFQKYLMKRYIYML